MWGRDGLSVATQSPMTIFIDMSKFNCRAGHSSGRMGSLRQEDDFDVCTAN